MLVYQYSIHMVKKYVIKEYKLQSHTEKICMYIGIYKKSLEIIQSYKNKTFTSKNTRLLNNQITTTKSSSLNPLKSNNQIPYQTKFSKSV